jgi:glycerol-3-phosphate acyltransferase PlsX
MSNRFSQLRDEVLRRRRERHRRPCVLALDAMGADIGPEEIMRGAHEAVLKHEHISVVAVGPAARLRGIQRVHDWTHPRLSVEDAPEVVGMDESPKESLKKRDSSVAVAARLVKEGRADGMVSPGNTGATMAHAMFQWRTLPGISRPSIAAFFPHPRRPLILLDVGANVDCRPKHLLHFGIMGSVYSRFMFHCRRPRVGVLSIGEEDSKGNDLVFDTQKLLRASTLNFVGNAEGRDLLTGSFDVVVCDGYVGNIVLKFGEGVVEFIFENLKEEVGRQFLTQIGALAMLPALKRFKKRVDYTEVGGAPLLGLNGTCVICHGSSRAKAIMNALRTASDLVGAKVNEHIVELAAENAAVGAEPATVAATK